ncbi:hypothetical protein CIB95_01650 [Lottiidibacillus patelloidae]|uniref:Carboxyltransferase domain-containing protein n=1 Tax=Lottiidibacillus patelloidae TaxID=2670334 RepID=A0A263BXL0_9BACI|nr:biotin-dependent carboxyltransferase family protein [Lottiidibacillus patelloidae]OZM58302.1 hypothetical protein CIB95_01650 [Lottiidibacillus patelloidae]
MSIEVITPGIYTTVQDLGRTGYQHIGVSPSGAFDTFAHRIANILVGNDESCATLEVTITGPTLKFNSQMNIALTGANLSPKLNGIEIENWRRYLVNEGDILRFAKLKSGCRAYLAVSGGIAGEKWLGSTSTYLQENVGGYKGRLLQKKDVLHVNQSTRTDNEEITKWKVSQQFLNHYYQKTPIRVLKGRHYDQFSEEELKKFMTNRYHVNASSNRMGYRLDGETIHRLVEQELVSEGVSNGTVQIPADGKPIVLMNDRQTIGGYPKIAQVISADLIKLAQYKPGEDLSFRFVSLQEAQNAYLMLEKELNILKAAVKLKGGI